jgi:hypothetical protein
MYRFSVDEVKDILTYGRPGSPMPAWGVKGGGPNTDQQLDTVIEYLWSVQITPDEMHKQVDDAVKAVDEGLYERMLAVREKNKDVLDATGPEYTRLDRADELMLGEVLFQLNDSTTGHQLLLVRPLPRSRILVRQAVEPGPGDGQGCLRPQPHRDRGPSHRDAALQPDHERVGVRQAVRLGHAGLGQDARLRSECQQRDDRRRPRVRPPGDAEPRAGVVDRDLRAQSLPGAARPRGRQARLEGED